jgi:hypothetical protein
MYYIDQSAVDEHVIVLSIWATSQIAPARMLPEGPFARFSGEDLWNAARICRVSRVLRPYLEANSSGAQRMDNGHK